MIVSCDENDAMEINLTYYRIFKMMILTKDSFS